MTNSRRRSKRARRLSENDNTRKSTKIKNYFVDVSDFCELISTKKESYYRFSTIKVPKILDHISDDIIDRTIYNNCCNCICLVLYTYDTTCADTIIKFLSSINKTILNVKKYLDDLFLVRIYIDRTVYDLLDRLDNDNVCKILINQIFIYDNVEIYTYNCNIDRTSYFKKIGKTRTYRLLASIDKSVAICAMRDADGIVTKLDAHCLRLFHNSQKMFYFTNTMFTRDDDRVAIWYEIPALRVHNRSYMYSKRLNEYCEKDTYYIKNKNAYNMLCGYVASRLKFTKKYFEKVVTEVSKKIETHHDRSFYNAMDEIVLMCLHKNILTYNNILDYDTVSPNIFDDFVFSDGNGVVNYQCKIKIGSKNSVKITDKEVTLKIKKEIIDYYKSLISPENNNKKHNRVINDDFILPLIPDENLKHVYKTRYTNYNTIVYLINFIDMLFDYRKIDTKTPFNIAFDLENFLDIFGLKLPTTFINILHINMIMNLPFNCTLRDLEIKKNNSSRSFKID